MRLQAQRDGETVSDFAERVRKLGEQAYADRLEEKEVTEIIPNSFISGLSDRRTQENVARTMPSTLAKAYKHALHEQEVREHLSLFINNASSPGPEPMDCDALVEPPQVLSVLYVCRISDPLMTQITAQIRPPAPTLVLPQLPRFQVHPQMQQRYRGPQVQQQYHGPRHPAQQQTDPRCMKDVTMDPDLTVDSNHRSTVGPRTTGLFAITVE